MTQKRFSNLTVLNSHRERTANPPPPPPQPTPPSSKEVIAGPHTLKTAPPALIMSSDSILGGNPEAM